MAEFPALPIFTDAFISDTLHLNATQTGAYLMLLMCAWRTKDCCLPDDDKKLAAFARMDKRSWAANKETIMSFWTHTSDGGWIQKRLIDERKLAEARRDHAVQAGKASALKRKGRHSTGVPTQRQPKVNNPLPNPLPLEDISPLTPQKKTGGFKNKNGNGEEPPFDIRFELSDDDIEAARQAAPGWDIHHLQKVYNEGVDGRGIPKFPGKAFVAWCKNYTKGKKR